MSFGHRKLSPFVEKTNVILGGIHESQICTSNCPDDCRRGSDDSRCRGLSRPPPPPSQRNHMPSILILMLCILGAAFVFLCYLMILRRYRSNLSSRRRNTAREDSTREDFIDENHGPMVIHPIWYINTVGLQQSVIDSIAVFKYKKGEGLIEGTDCSVCLSEFQDDESLRLLPKCSHAFHNNCIDTWLRSHQNCPLCRAPVVRDVIPETNESVLNNSGSLETTPADAQSESHEVIDDGTNQATTGVENMGHLPNEESKILEMLKKNPQYSTTRNNRIRILSDLVDHRVKVDEELQPVRRSVSMDGASASMIYAAVAKIHPVQEEGCSKVQELELKKHNSVKGSKPGDTKLIIHKSRKSFSFGRSLQNMPIRMKRSFSSSSKSSLPRQSRSQELVQTF